MEPCAGARTPPLTISVMLCGPQLNICTIRYAALIVAHVLWKLAVAEEQRVMPSFNLTEILFQALYLAGRQAFHHLVLFISLWKRVWFLLPLSLLPLLFLFLRLLLLRLLPLFLLLLLCCLRPLLLLRLLALLLLVLVFQARFPGMLC